MLEKLERNASKAFWLLFFAHLLCWTLIPAFVQPNAPLDTIEGLAWGHEWPLGTYKHPPLQAWLLEAVTYVFGKSGLGFFGLSALCGGITLWAVWRTGRLFTGRVQALFAAALAQSIFYVNILSPEFNPNVLQLTLGALSTYAFAHALLRQKLTYWLLLGVFMALGVYAKYSMALYAISFVLFMLANRETRPLLFRTHAYIALVTCLVLAMPHLMWLQNNNFAPFAYAASRAERAAYWWQYLLFPAKFFGSQILAMLATLLLAGAMLLPLQKNNPPHPFMARLLFWLAWGPLLLVLAVSGFSGEKLRDMWGMPLLTFIPLWAICTFKIRTERLPFFMSCWAATFAFSLALFCGNILLSSSLGAKPLRGNFPGQQIAAYIHSKWQADTKTPLLYVIGDAWMAGNVAFYGPDTRNRPHVWIDGSPQTSPWIDYDDVTRKGAVIIWRVYDEANPALPGWAASFPDIKVQKIAIFSWKNGKNGDFVLVGWAIIPPSIKIQ